MRRLKGCLPIRTRKQIYYSLVHSSINYGILVWGSCGVTFMNRLVNLQRKLVTMLSSSDESLSSFQSARVLSVDEIYNFNLGQLMYRILDGSYHEPLTDMVSVNQIEHGHETRFKTGKNLRGLYCRTTRAQQSAIYRASQNWNSIPVNIRSAESLPNFKCRYKRYLLGI